MLVLNFIPNSPKINLNIPNFLLIRPPLQHSHPSFFLLLIHPYFLIFKTALPILITPPTVHSVLLILLLARTHHSAGVQPTHAHGLNLRLGGVQHLRATALPIAQLPVPIATPAQPARHEHAAAVRPAGLDRVQQWVQVQLRHVQLVVQVKAPAEDAVEPQATRVVVAC